MEDWKKDMMLFFQECDGAKNRAERAGRDQRQEAKGWVLSVVTPAFDAVLPTLTYGGRSAQPMTYPDATPEPHAVFPVKQNHKDEFEYRVQTVVDADGLEANVITSPSVESRYSEPTSVSDITVEGLRDDLIQTYKASLLPVPAVM